MSAQNDIKTPKRGPRQLGKHRVSISLDAATWERVREAAALEGVSASLWVRLAVQHELAMLGMSGI